MTTAHTEISPSSLGFQIVAKSTILLDYPHPLSTSDVIRRKLMERCSWS